MPYDPQAPTERERSGAFILVWIGLAASLMMLAGHVLPVGGGVRAVATAAAGSLMIVFLVSRRYDSYFRQLRDFGACAGLGVIALWLAAYGLLLLIGASYTAGVAVGGGAAVSAEPSWVPPAWLADARLVAGLAAAGFHAGFLFAHLRGGR